MRKIALNLLRFKLGIIVFLISFVFYFAILYIIKEQFFWIFILVFLALFLIHFLVRKLELCEYKIASLIGLVLAILINLHLMGVIDLLHLW